MQAFQVKKHQYVVFVPLPQQDFVHPQHRYQPLRLAETARAPSLPFEDLQYHHLVQPFLKCDLLTGGILHAFVDVLLKTLCLSPFRVDPRQVLGEGLIAHSTIKTPLRKIGQRSHPPDVQVAHAALSRCVNMMRRLLTTWADGYVVFVFAEQMQILLPLLFLNGKPGHVHTRQSQQIAQGGCDHRFRCQLGYAFHRSCCILGNLSVGADSSHHTSSG